MSSPLDGKICIVTGASRGIGHAIAARLASDGARVAAIARNVEKLDALSATHESITSYPTDVASEDDVARVVNAIAEDHGGVDALINNAGVGAFGGLDDIDYQEFLRGLEVNVGGTFLFTRAVVPSMKKRGGGDIINIASVTGWHGYPRQAGYGASKHAVIGLTKSLAVELQDDNIRVRSVSPGGVDTDMIADARPDLDRSVLMRPEHIADVVAYLLAAPEGAVIDNINIRRSGSKPWY